MVPLSERSNLNRKIAELMTSFEKVRLLTVKRTTKTFVALDKAEMLVARLVLLGNVEVHCSWYAVVGDVRLLRMQASSVWGAVVKST